MQPVSFINKILYSNTTYFQKPCNFCLQCSQCSFWLLSLLTWAGCWINLNTEFPGVYTVLCWPFLKELCANSCPPPLKQPFINTKIDAIKWVLALADSQLVRLFSRRQEIPVPHTHRPASALGRDLAGLGCLLSAWTCLQRAGRCPVLHSPIPFIFLIYYVSEIIHSDLCKSLLSLNSA